MSNPSPTTPLSLRDVYRRWWPLAVSWAFMALEPLSVNAVIARLPDPQTHLAALGGVAMPLAFFVEAPVIMLLAASTALCRDRGEYDQVRRYMLALIGVLTALHLLLCITPIYSVIAERWLGTPPELASEAQLAFLLLAPFAPAVGYRRFQQGILIRLGQTKLISIGTTVRLGAIALALLLGAVFFPTHGASVGALAISSGVIGEAIFIHLCLKQALPSLPPATTTTVGWKKFLSFYSPLALTTVIFMTTQPIGSAALSRMPEAALSLAAWPVVGGLVFLIRSVAVAFNEVVISLLDRPQALAALRRFTGRLALGCSAVLFLVAATPLASLWSRDIAGLSSDLAPLAEHALWFALPGPFLSTLHSWYQGVLIHEKQSRCVTEAVFIHLLTFSATLSLLVLFPVLSGIHGVFLAFSFGGAAQAWWLRRRALRFLAA